MLKLTDSDFKRYWSKIEVRRLDECWPWLGGVSRKGYGVFSVSHCAVNKTHNAHRVGLALRLGNLPDDIHALHSCDNRLCQNPHHVFPGTNDENIADKMAKNRHRGPRGEAAAAHKLTASDVIAIRAEYARHEQSGIRLKDIAAKYAVGWKAIQKICARTRWKHIA